VKKTAAHAATRIRADFALRTELIVPPNLKYLDERAAQP
jgi:hypothetical protein